MQRGVILLFSIHIILCNAFFKYQAFKKCKHIYINSNNTSAFINIKSKMNRIFQVPLSARTRHKNKNNQ
jgi:hypothetical protein